MAVTRRHSVRPVLGGMILTVTMLTPAAAQQPTPTPAKSKQAVPVLTNANIGKSVPLNQRHTLTPEEWQSFVAHQYVAVATPTPYERWYAMSGPHVVVIPDSTPQPYIPPSYPLSGSYYAPFYVQTPVYPVIYPGWNSYSMHRNGSRPWSDNFPHHAPPMRAPQPTPKPPPTVQRPPTSVPSVSVGIPAPRGR